MTSWIRCAPSRLDLCKRSLESASIKVRVTQEIIGKSIDDVKVDVRGCYLKRDVEVEKGMINVRTLTVNITHLICNLGNEISV